MLPQELLKTIRRIEIRSSHLADDLLSGQYHSAFKGRGVEFEEVRPYQIGDDVRTIDWNVTARYNEPYIKLFREERELTVILLVDFSGSQGVGTRGQLKRELVAELGATLAYSAIRNNDKVGMIGFSSEVEKFVPVRKGPKHVLRVIRELLYTRPTHRGTNITKALQHLNKTVKRRAVVFLISDFQDKQYDKALQVARRKHDIIAVDISDPRERELPNVGLVELLDVETGRRMMVDTSRRKNRERFARKAQRLVDARELLFRKLNVDSIQLQTGDDFISPLRQFFRRREARR